MIHKDERTRSDVTRKNINKMKKRKFIDRRSIVYGIAGMLLLLCGFSLEVILENEIVFDALLIVSVFLAVLGRVIYGKQVRPVAFVMGGALTLLILAITLVVFLYVTSDGPEPFDPDRWQHMNRGIEGNWPYRKNMVDDLLAHYDFNGWDKQSVFSLLGSPDGYDWPKSGDVTYETGSDGWNTRMLLFHFAGNDKVESYRIMKVGF